jgi:hypothetical protein
VEFGHGLAWLSPVESTPVVIWPLVLNRVVCVGVCCVLVCACACGVFLFWGTYFPFSFA